MSICLGFAARQPHTDTRLQAHRDNRSKQALIMRKRFSKRRAQWDSRCPLGCAETLRAAEPPFAPPFAAHCAAVACAADELAKGGATGGAQSDKLDGGAPSRRPRRQARREAPPLALTPFNEAIERLFCKGAPDFPQRLISCHFGSKIPLGADSIGENTYRIDRFESIRHVF